MLARLGMYIPWRRPGVALHILRAGPCILLVLPNKESLEDVASEPCAVAKLNLRLKGSRYDADPSEPVPVASSMSTAPALMMLPP